MSEETTLAYKQSRKQARKEIKENLIRREDELKEEQGRFEVEIRKMPEDTHNRVSSL